MTDLLDPETPFAVVDRSQLDANVERIRRKLATFGVPLRLHVKTSKSVDVARRVFPEGPGPITVSTLAEAEHFADAGYVDMVYAVGIAPQKLERVIALRERGVDLAVLLDSIVQADAVAAASRRSGERIPALIEIDCDGHRGGLLPDDPDLTAIGSTLHEQGGELRGVLDHAGESYFASTAEARTAASLIERSAAVHAAEALRSAGLPCPVVSVGSTPTAFAASNLDGVTEVRAGNFVFFDLVMAGIGVCDHDALALSIVVTVIGHKHEKGWIVTDGGWMATSRDRGTADQSLDQGYGIACQLDGDVMPNLIVVAASQEHGILAIRPEDEAPLPDLPIGARLRILPNHACATAAQFSAYHVVDELDETRGRAIIATWPRSNGW
jgi:D-serine deaminase-like pyridoxal phosphate-dependent protein